MISRISLETLILRNSVISFCIPEYILIGKYKLAPNAGTEKIMSANMMLNPILFKVIGKWIFYLLPQQIFPFIVGQDVFVKDGIASLPVNTLSTPFNNPNVLSSPGYLMLYL